MTPQQADYIDRKFKALEDQLHSTMLVTQVQHQRIVQLEERLVLVVDTLAQALGAIGVEVAPSHGYRLSNDLRDLMFRLDKEMTCDGSVDAQST